MLARPPRHARVAHRRDCAPLPAARLRAAAAPGPEYLEAQRQETLVQARVGNGIRGRGLFFTPAPPAQAPQPSLAGGALPPPPPPVVRVPLAAGLTVVMEGPQWLQQQLLQEWQAHHGVELPRDLAVVLLDISQPPALRLAAWLLWAVRHAPLLAAYADAVLPSVSSGASCLRLAPRAAAALLPTDVVDALERLQAQAMSYVEQLRELGLAEGVTAPELCWAFDLVTSRCFAATAALPPPPRSDGAPQPPASATARLGLYIPWACLVNHSAAPNVGFGADLAKREFTVFSRLRYSPLEQGVELCISYGNKLDNAQLLLQYGFVTLGNDNDRLPMPDAVAAAARRLPLARLRSVAEAVADREASAAAAAAAATAAAAGAEGSAEGRLGTGTAAADSVAGEAAAAGAAAAQQRTRVYAALLTLLEAGQGGEEAPAGEPGGGGAGASAADAGAVVLEWARAASVAMAPPAAAQGGSHDPEASSEVGDAGTRAAQLHVRPEVAAAAASLWDERRRIARCMCELLRAAGE